MGTQSCKVKDNDKMFEYNIHRLFEYCEKLEHNSMANRTCTSCYNIKILNIIWKKFNVFLLNLYTCMKGDTFSRLKGK